MSAAVGGLPPIPAYGGCGCCDCGGQCGTPSPSVRGAAWRADARRARVLAWISLAYMTVEGALALTAALRAGSVALLGFGLDSVIEAAASIIVIWRFTGARALSENAEQRAHKAVAATFFLLAPYIAYDAIATLVAGHHPATSPLGIALSITSLTVMPLLAAAKRRLGGRLDSAATVGEGGQNLLCAYLAAAVLIGLLGNTLLGAWWLDPAIGLLVAALAVREGRQAWRGEDCAC